MSPCFIPPGTATEESEPSQHPAVYWHPLSGEKSTSAHYWWVLTFVNLGGNKG